jgi:hypothetical protein
MPLVRRAHYNGQRGNRIPDTRIFRAPVVDLLRPAEAG